MKTENSQSFETLELMVSLAFMEQKKCSITDIKDVKCVNNCWSVIYNNCVFAVELTPKKTKVKSIKYLWSAKDGLWD